MILKIFFVILIAISNTVFAAPSTWVYNETKNELLAADESNTRRSIASITKLMTALVAIDHNSDMTAQMKIGKGSRLPPGITQRGDLFTAMLVRSDNQAAEFLAQDYPGGRKAFIVAMNNKAKNLGMDHATFVDPSGLMSGNVATIGDVATLVKAASQHPIISNISILQQVEIDKKKYKVVLENTNRMLLASFDEIKISKTGFTSSAGWCVAMVLEKYGQRIVVVVLGAKSKDQRYNIAKDLIKSHLADLEYKIEQEQNKKSLIQKLLEGVY